MDSRRNAGRNCAIALLAQAAAGPVLDVVVSPYGSRYIVCGSLRTPSGRAPEPMVCTVWQADNGADGVRLITAYPAWANQEM
jgi:hypothetical protein